VPAFSLYREPAAPLPFLLVLFSALLVIGFHGRHPFLTFLPSLMTPSVRPASRPPEQLLVFHSSSSVEMKLPLISNCTVSVKRPRAVPFRPGERCFGIPPLEEKMGTPLDHRPVDPLAFPFFFLRPANFGIPFKGNPRQEDFSDLPRLSADFEYIWTGASVDGRPPDFFSFFLSPPFFAFLRRVFPKFPFFFSFPACLPTED